MLVFTRKPGERILIGDDIEIIVCRIDGDKIRIGITAPAEVKILRPEHLERKESE